MKRQTRTSLVFLLIAAWGPFGPAIAADWWQSGTNQPPSLVSLFGPNADSQWNRLNGKFEIADDPESNRKILAIGKDTDLQMEGRTIYNGDYEVRTLVRLPTDVVPGGYLRLHLAKKDSKDPGLSVTLTSAKTTEAISYTVRQNGKDLRVFSRICG